MWTKTQMLTVLGLLSLGVGVAQADSALDGYYLRPTDLPPGCTAVSGTYPAGPKIAALYQYTAYQSVLPKLADRHAQSFQCGSQKGSIFFFQYGSTSDKEAAALFAKPVLSKEAAGWVDWPLGFAVVSFMELPESLLNAVEAKVKGRATVTSAAPAVSAPPPSATSAPAKKAASATPSAASLPYEMATSTAVGTSAPTSMPAAASPTAATGSTGSQTPAGSVADISDIALDTLIGSVGCETATQSETKKVCSWLSDFKSGRKPGSSITADAPVIGQAYRIDSYGRLEEKFIDVLVGNGQPGGVTLFSIQPANGLEDYEAQALVEARQAGKPLPSNSIAARIAKEPRPASVGVVEAGNSWALTSEGAEKRTFLRKQKDGRWMVLSVASDNPDEQTRSSFAVATLH